MSDMGVRLLDANVDPNTVTFPGSVARFQKLAKDFGLTVRVQVTKVYVEPVYYAQSSKRRGEVKSEGHERINVFLTLTDLEVFLLNASWFGPTFHVAFMGAPKWKASKPMKMMEALKEARTWLT